MSKELDAYIAKINKQAKSQVIVKGSDLKDKVIPRVTTGSLAFDLMLGGGWPLNCWNEVIGHESNGKTVMALKTLAANQALNPKYEVLWVASEHFNLEWAQDLGVDLDRVALVETQAMEEAYQYMDDALSARAVDAIVLDSYPALIASQEAEKSMMDLTIGRGAMITAQFMRKSGSSQRRSLVDEDRPCLGIIINQWREKIGVMYGDPRTTPGGKAKNFSYHTRVEVSRDDWLSRGDTKVGLAIKARTVKNKTAPPQRVGQVDFYFSDASPFAKGDYDTVKEVAAISMSLGLVARKGSYYTYGDQQWQGKEGLFGAIREDLDLQADLSAQVRKLVLHDSVLPASAIEEEDDPKPASKPDQSDKFLFPPKPTRKVKRKGA